MTQFEEDVTLANDIVFVLKNIENGEIGSDPGFTFSHGSGTKWLTYYGYTVSHMSSGSGISANYSQINLTKGIIRHNTIKDGVRIFHEGGLKIISDTDPVLMVSEEQHFQNSLIYEEAHLRIFTLYGTLLAHNFHNNYNMLSLVYIERLKKSMQEGIYDTI